MASCGTDDIAVMVSFIYKVDDLAGGKSLLGIIGKFDIRRLDGDMNLDVIGSYGFS